MKADERTLRALETIADQLRMIAKFMIPTIAPECSEKSATDFGQTLTANQVWENEGGWCARLLGSGLLWLPPVMQEVSDRVGS